MKTYGIRTVRADRYAGQWVVDAFAKCGIHCEQSAARSPELYGELLPLLNGYKVELLDHPRLHAQLGFLERRTSRGGRDSIDHAPGGHDDVANAVAGAVVAAAQSGIGGPQVMAVNLAPEPRQRVDWETIAAWRGSSMAGLTRLAAGTRDMFTVTLRPSNVSPR